MHSSRGDQLGSPMTSTATCPGVQLTGVEEVSGSQDCRGSTVTTIMLPRSFAPNKASAEPAVRLSIAVSLSPNRLLFRQARSTLLLCRRSGVFRESGGFLKTVALLRRLLLEADRICDC